MSEDSKLLEDQRKELNQKVQFNRHWQFKEQFPKISTYTTTYNVLKGKYPLVASLKSWLQISDELVVVDGGSTDGTREMLQELSEEDSRIKIYDIPIDLDMPGKDGYQKAMARSMTSGQFSIQFDIDEILLGSPEQWKRLCKDFPQADILNLMVLEPFGDIKNLRLNKSHNPTKWRIYRNKPEITHGIPKQDKFDRDGKTYSKGGSDGCFPVNLLTEDLYPSTNHKSAKRTLLLFNQKPEQYKQFIQEELKKETPMVLHLGHVNLYNKISFYKSSWHRWWCELYGKDTNLLENNLFFPGVKLEDVSDTMVCEKVSELQKETPVVCVEELEQFKKFTE